MTRRSRTTTRRLITWISETVPSSRRQGTSPIQTISSSGKQPVCLSSLIPPPSPRRVLLMIACCHTVTATIDYSGETAYCASSPDEFALVNFAKFAGVEFLRLEKGASDSTIMVIRIRSEEIKLKLLHVFEFDSNRKRQSIIIEDPISESIYLFCKGADSVVTSKLSDTTDPSTLRSLNEKLKHLGSQGLRTLMLAER